MSWIEVETKVKLNNSQIHELRKRIKQIATLKKKGTKSDNYFAIQEKGFPKKALRFRTIGNKIELTFKKHLKYLWTKKVIVKQEFEFNLKNKNNMNDLIKLFQDFGFKKWITKIKRNETYEHKKNKNISIEINHVKHLGYFIEIEYLCQKKDTKKATNAIIKTLKELEIDPNQIDNTGYTKMLWDKKIKIKTND